MNIATLLSEERTLCGAPSGSKKKALQQIADLCSASIDGLEAADLFSHLLAREKLGSTGLGQGIAIPHCRLPGCPTVMGALITLDQPIDFEAIDDKPVDILFSLVVPDDADGDHLEALAAIAERMRDPAFCQSLRSATNTRALHEAATSLSGT